MLVGDYMEIKTFAKINLSLYVVGKTDNGYHKLDMIMQTISLYDTIYVSKREKGIKISANNPEIPLGPDNIAYKAADLMLRSFNLSSGVNIHIEKNIPIGAGLAGGSTNAAGVIKLINEIYNLKLKEKDLDKLALKLGADVPFCLRQGTYEAKGIGEILTPIEAGFKNQLILLVKPEFSISTKETFSKVQGRFSKDLKTDKLIKAIKNKDIESMNKNMENDLEKIIVEDFGFKEIKEIKERLYSLGAKAALMSGSGPTVYGIFDEKKLALMAENEFRKKYKETFLVYTL